MASDETTTLQDEGHDLDDDDVDDGFSHNHNHNHPHNLPRLSVCTSSTLGVDDDVDNLVSRLSIESFDADGELSDGKELSSDSENELGTCCSLLSAPPRRRNRVKNYASDNGGDATKKNDPRRFEFEGGAEKKKKNKKKKSKRKEEEEVVHGFSGESDQSQSGVMLITRPKGGNRALCMDLEEVKACRDLGFELEHQRMLEIPSHLSFSNSTLDTSSISSPGDDPRDVKARLKLWAQAVALVSASKYGT